MLLKACCDALKCGGHLGRLWVDVRAHLVTHGFPCPFLHRFDLMPSRISKWMFLLLQMSWGRLEQYVKNSSRNEIELTVTYRSAGPFRFVFLCIISCFVKDH
jgi:hypothetical protein